MTTLLLRRFLFSATLHFQFGRLTGRGLRFQIQDLHAKIADFAQIESGELRNRLAHFAKHIFDRIDAVLLGAGLNQIAQNFPIVARRTGPAHRAIQSLQAALAIDHRAALLRETERRENRRRQRRGFVRQNIHDDECRKRRELFRRDAELERIFAERDERPDFVAATALAISGQFRTRLTR